MIIIRFVLLCKAKASVSRCLAIRMIFTSRVRAQLVVSLLYVRPQLSRALSTSLRYYAMSNVEYGGSLQAQ